MTLTVEGLPFQQQDRGVAACATTAIWTALQRVCRRESDRPPTPTEVTLAGVQYLAPHGRSFPSSGLSFEQMCEALRNFDYAPFVFRFKSDYARFQFIFQAYLRSGIPLILALQDEGDEDGHAITVVGYRSTRAVTRMQIDEQRFELMAGPLTEIYVHDDRIGPYARAFLRKRTVNGKAQVQIESQFTDGSTQAMNLWLVAAPLYHKLRATPDDLLAGAVELIPFVRQLAKGQAIGIDCWFEMSGDYLAGKFGHGLDGTRLARFVGEVCPSRYVGVMRWFLNRKPCIESIWDTTDVTGGRYNQLLGLLSLDPRYNAAVDWFGRSFSVVVG